MTSRSYLDWNATAPLRPQAREAMLDALDKVGNPSSVHGEGRAVKAIIEKAREQIAAAVGARAAQVVFTSSATEAAALALAGRNLSGSGVEHSCVRAWTREELGTDQNGLVSVEDPAHSVLQLANGETGVIQTLPEGMAFVDAVQGFGKIPFAFEWTGAQTMAIAAHKIGGPKGVGALILADEVSIEAQIKGGGQELGRRAGTENIAGIAGFGAAAETALADLNAGVWQGVEALRDEFEGWLAAEVEEVVFFGKQTKRLPNTSYFAVPGWKGETQVMQMDLAGYAVSAGSACSSGKVRASHVLRAMGFDDLAASSAIRVSIGPNTTREDLSRFAEVWTDTYRIWRKRAA